MLKKISISNVATYPATPQELNDLGKINFVYGSNGSGKTTISRIIAHPEQYASCSTTWEGNLQLQAFVYNRDFVEENFKQTDSIRGIFTLGSDNNSIRESIEEKQRKINECEDAIKNALKNLEGVDGISGKRKELMKTEGDIADHCWNKIKKPYDGVFQNAFEGMKKSKSKFAEVVLEKFTPKALPHRGKDELIKEAETVFKDNASIHDMYKVPDVDLLTRNLRSDIYTQIIVGGKDIDIAELISKLGNSDWVRQGQKILPQSNGRCPFCQQELPANFSDKLTRYFDETFIANIEKLEKEGEECKRLLSELAAYVEEVQESPDDGFLDLDAFRLAKQSLDAKMSLIRKSVDEKVKEPSRSIAMPTVEEEIKTICSIVSAANDKVAKHNSLVSNLEESKRKLIDDIWIFLIEENRAPLSNLLSERENLRKTVDGLEKSIALQKELKDGFAKEIVAMQKQLTSVLPTIEVINKLLDSFGFTSFRLAPAEETSYKLQRLDGADVGDTLSEGEKSFVSFLYYYYLLKGGTDRDTIINNRIAVIDDPVSSLDSNILFVVSALIHECIADILKDKGCLKQLIVLTHNVYFFKEITFVPKNKDKLGCGRKYWVVRKDANVSDVKPMDSNPIKTSYELLWQEIQSGNSKIGIQNAMRRIVEYYFRFLGGILQDEIEEKFHGVDRIICKSLFAWMNDGSHSIDDDLHYQVVDAEIDAYKTVFKRIFYESHHGAHYDMMMQHVGRGQARDT